MLVGYRVVEGFSKSRDSGFCVVNVDRHHHRVALMLKRVYPTGIDGAFKHLTLGLSSCRYR